MPEQDGLDSVFERSRVTGAFLSPFGSQNLAETPRRCLTVSASRIQTVCDMHLQVPSVAETAGSLQPQDKWQDLHRNHSIASIGLGDVILATLYRGDLLSSKD